MSCKVASLPQLYSVEVNPVVTIEADWVQLMVYPVLWKCYVVMWAVTMLYLCNVRLHVCFVTIDYNVLDFLKDERMAFVVSCSMVVWWCWIFFVSWYCGIYWTLRFFWHWMSRIQFSELQYHVVCWIGTVIWMILLPPSSGQKMLATSFLETFVPFYKTTVCHIQEDHNLNVCHSQNLRSHLGNLLIGWVAVGICIGNRLLCNMEFIFSSMQAIMSVRMYWMWQCVSGGDRRVVDPETNLTLASSHKTCFLSL